MDDKRTSPARTGPYHLFMLALCVYVILALAVETLFRLDPRARQLLEYADTAVCVVFLADFVLCLARAPRKLKYLYTWGWVDLLSSIPLPLLSAPFLRLGRLARVFRLLRVLRGVRAARLLGAAILERRSQSVFLAIVLATLLMVVVGSVAVLHFEADPDSRLRTPQDALWWAIFTLASTEYGDCFPVTPEGRIVAFLLVAGGIAIFGTFAGFIASWFLDPGERRQNLELDQIRAQLEEIRRRLESGDGRPPAAPE